MKKLILILLITPILSFGQTRLKKIKNEILFIATLPKLYTEFKDIYDKSPQNTVLNALKQNKSSNHSIKISSKIIPDKFSNQIELALKNFDSAESFFNSMYSTSPLIKIEKNSFKKRIIDGKNFYEIIFYGNNLKHFSVSTFYRNNLISIIYSSFSPHFDIEIGNYKMFLSSLKIN